MRALLFAGPRRSAGDGQRRSAARTADRAQEIRRGDRDPRRRRAADVRLRHPVAAARPIPMPASASNWSSALARAAGLGGMVGGQMLDLAAEGRFAGTGPQRLGENEVRTLQAMKTGALLRFACEAGGMLGAATAAAAQGARPLRLGGRPGLPDRRRSSRSRRRSRAGRQTDRQGRGCRQGHHGQRAWRRQSEGTIGRAGRRGRTGAGAVRRRLRRS